MFTGYSGQSRVPGPRHRAFAYIRKTLFSGNIPFAALLLDTEAAVKVQPRINPFGEMFPGLLELEKGVEVSFRRWVYLKTLRLTCNLITEGQ